MGLLNGWTKSQVKKVVDNHFKGRAWVPSNKEGASRHDGRCVYLAPDGKKCGVGLFIPDGHESQDADAGVYHLIRTHFPELESMMPLSVSKLEELQRFHDEDGDFKFATVEKQKKMIYSAIMKLARGQEI